MRFPVRAVVVLLSLTCSAAQNAQPRVDHPNIVLITLDTVRADHVGCYGARAVSTPTLDGLARDGIVFERAIAQVPLTYPSHASLMTGLYPFQNGAQDFTSAALDARFRTLAQALHDHGYATGAVVSSFALDHSWGLGRGFDFYDDAFSPESYERRDLGLVERKAEESVTHALHWLQTAPKRPFFLWLHLYDPHSPYSPPEPFRSKYANHLYDGEIAYADQQLSRLIDWLKGAHLYDRSLIFVASDHGESLGDHGEQEHGFFVYNSTLHVPLILKPPAGAGLKAGRNRNLVELVGIPSTILQIAGVSDELTKQCAPPISREAADLQAYSETFYPFNTFGWSPLHSLVSGRFHFIEAPIVELYDQFADVDEKNNLAASQPATVEVMRKQLQVVLAGRRFQEASEGQSQLSAEAQQKLRALGYVAYRSPVPETALMAGLADPKSNLREFNEIREAQDAIHGGDFARGRELLSAVREHDPKMYIVPFYLGEAALAQQQWLEASSEFKTCLQLSPQFEPAMTGLARALTFQGNPDEAREWASRALSLNPQSYQALYELGFLESKVDRKRAIDYYERAVVIQPSYSPLQRDLGLLKLQEGDFAASAQHLENAVRLGANDASIWNALGIAYAKTDRLTRAVQAYQRALALTPGVAEIHLNLASAYERLQHPKDARAEYDEACRLNPRYCR